MKSGRIVLITGAAGGIGTVLVRRFLENGDTVVATDKTDELLARLDAPANDGSLRRKAADVTSETSVAELASFVKDAFGHVDVLINCVGFYPIQPFKELTLDTWNEVVDVNLTGVFLVLKATLPLMQGRGWGRIINFSSGSMWNGLADQTPYVTSKAGVLGLSRCIAREVGSDNITVNVIMPGLTLTPHVVETLPEELKKSQLKVRALQRDEHAEDIVGSVFFLASPDADFVSGQTINIDGGAHML